MFLLNLNDLQWKFMHRTLPEPTLLVGALARFRNGVLVWPAWLSG